MKICHVTNWLPGYHKTWGGAERACYRTIKLLVKNGYDADVVSTRPIKVPKEDFNFFSLKLQEDFFGKLGNYIEWFKEGAVPFDMISYLQFYKILKKIKPDVLHLHNFKLLSFSLVSAAKALKIPIVSSIYDYWFFCPISTLFNSKGRPCKKFHGSYCTDCIKKLPKIVAKPFLTFRKSIFDYFLNKIDAFVVLSKSSARILESYGIPKRKIHLIPLIFSLKEASIKKVKFEKNLILYAGWFVRHKGLHVLINAMPEILKEVPDAKLIAVGETKADPEYTKFIIDLIKKNNLDNKVSVLGKISDKEFEKIYQKANVVVILEQWENMSPVFLIDSMVNAKPIVASKIGGMPEFIKNGRNGLLSKPHDSHDFAKKIIYILKNRKKAETMGKTARKDIYKMFNEDAILRKLTTLYQSLIK